MLMGSSIFAHAQMDLLTMKELGQLDNRARIYYIETYREMMVSLSSFQKKFGIKLAQEVSPQQKLWNLIFETAEAGQIFGRGANRELDRCIWAGNLQTYSGVGR